MMGVYRIHNTVTGDDYIGSSTDIDQCWYDHKKALNRRTHRTTSLQAAWNEFGETAFELLVVEEVTDRTQLLMREAAALDEFNPSYNSARISVARLEKIEESRRWALDRSWHVWEWPTDQEINDLPDAKVGIFTCPDCESVHSLEFRYGQFRVRNITRKEADDIKFTYLLSKRTGDLPPEYEHLNTKSVEVRQEE